jgi:uncharacterized integral membrane protein
MGGPVLAQAPSGFAHFDRENRSMSRTKLVLAAVIAVLTLIVVLQNIQLVETHLLFVTITMPRAFLLAGTLAVGFVLGFMMRRH